MKKTHKWLLVGAFLGLSFLLGAGIASRLAHKQNVAEQTRVLPNLTFQSYDGSPVHLNVGTQPTVLIYFEPDCDHCQQEATEYRKAAQTLEAMRVLWLSSAARPAVEQFAVAYGLVPNQVVLLNREVAYKKFGFSAVPNIMIYRADGSLVRRFKGVTSFKEIHSLL